MEGVGWGSASPLGVFVEIFFEEARDGISCQVFEAVVNPELMGKCGPGFGRVELPDCFLRAQGGDPFQGDVRGEIYGEEPGGESRIEGLSKGDAKGFPRAGSRIGEAPFFRVGLFIVGGAGAE